MFILEARYVMALLSAVDSHDVADKIGEDLNDFLAVMKKDNIFFNFMLNPAISSRLKRDTLNKIFTNDTPEALKNFISLLIDKGRLKLLPGICLEYKRLKAELRGAIIINVSSSITLGDDQLDEIRKLYMKKYGAVGAEIEQKIDSTLLGGVVIKIGDLCIDNSLLGRINGIQKSIVDTRIDMKLA